MEMFNKFKTSLSTSVTNTIQNTVYNTGNIISGVIPGNPVTREFEITSHVGSAGPGLLWKVYSAVKKSTRQEASVFVLERSQLDRFDKQDRDALWDLFKKGVSQLTRLRHPQILTVEHPLEESRDCLAFASEPVIASLANVIGWLDNLPNPPPQRLSAYKLFPVEIKYGLLQVSEGLVFLHNSARMLHRNLSPESILINSQGAWKIAGFEYCLSSVPGGQGVPSWECPEYDHNLPPESYPHLDFSAPELALLGTVTPAADMFSFGMLAFCVHNRRSLYQCERNWGVYKRRVSDLKTIPAERLTSIPNDLVDYLKMLLSPTPDLRPTPDEVQQLQYFQDVGVKTLQLLDSQFQWDNLQKSQFYKGLPGVLPQLPHRVALHRVYPCLAKEFVNASMVPFVLPPAIQISKEASKEEFATHILPALKPVMKIMDPIQILLIFMQNMELLLEKTPVEDVKSDVLPMLYRALECDVSQIQELCLTILPEFAGLLDKQSLKTALTPRIKKLCLTTRLLSVRVNALICIGKLLEYLDKWQVIDEILPMLAQMPSKEPAVIMGTIGIIKISLNSSKLGLTKEVMANKVLPFLIPLSIENGLTVAQYDSVCELIKDMMRRIETEHRSKLEQLNSLQEEQKKSFNVSLPAGQLVAAPSLKETTEMDSMFAGLGLGSYISKDRSAFDPAKEAFITESKPAPPSSSQPGVLSLQEKQRILREQESLQRKTNSIKSPTTVDASRRSVSPNPNSSQAKDLSDSLMNKSLSMNQIQSRQANNHGMQGQTGTPISPSMNFSMSSSSTMLNPSNGMSTAGMSMNAQMASPMMGSTNNMFTTTNNNNLNTFQSSPSGLSSINPIVNSQAARPSMNAMKTSQSQNFGLLQPTGSGLSLLQPSNAAYNSTQFGSSVTSKPLSQSDINDLLS